MKKPTLMQQNMVAVAEIDASRRLRPVTEAGVESLIASIGETGVMKDAIHVRKRKDGSLVLIAGAHRLVAAERLGWTEIEAKVWTEVTDDWAALMEIDDNLAGAEMNALDTAVFLATRKAVYERLHPETKRGVAGAVARWDATDMMSVASFSAATAEKFGLTDRHVRRMIAAGSALGADQIAALRGAPRAVTLKDLAELSKYGPTDRYEVVQRLSEGRAKSAADAFRVMRAAKNGPVPIKRAADQQFLALMTAWQRASTKARKRFLFENAKDIWHEQNAGPALDKWSEADGA